MKTDVTLTEEELVAKIITGETAFFELLVRRNNQYLYRIGKMYRFSQEDTQDLMQESFVNAYIHLRSFHGKSSFKTWISKIMLNACFHQSKKNKNQYMESFDNSTAEIKSSANDPISEIMSTELITIIENRLLKLGEDYRTVFMVREINGMSVAETADLLGITENNVKVRMNRAKQMLRAELEKSYKKEELFEFNMVYCNPLTERIMSKIAEVKML